MSCIETLLDLCRKALLDVPWVVERDREILRICARVPNAVSAMAVFIISQNGVVYKALRNGAETGQVLGDVVEFCQALKMKIDPSLRPVRHAAHVIKTPIVTPVSPVRMRRQTGPRLPMATLSIVRLNSAIGTAATPVAANFGRNGPSDEPNPKE